MSPLAEFAERLEGSTPAKSLYYKSEKKSLGINEDIRIHLKRRRNQKEKKARDQFTSMYIKN